MGETDATAEKRAGAAHARPRAHGGSGPYAGPGGRSMTRRGFVAGALAAGAAMLAGCTSSYPEAESAYASPTGDLALDMTAWNYDEDNKVYWQVGLAYCTAPQLEAYETMGLYVPGKYLSGTANGDGTYTCELNGSGRCKGFTAATAPIVIPVNTAGYAAQAAPTSYSYDSVSAYLEQGFVYAYPGCRGRDNGETDDGATEYGGGAPWGVTDLKAAIRYLRYNSAVLPGNHEAIFTFGHSGGGAQSSLVGVTGDSDLYTPYLREIGAAMEDAAGTAISDAIAGAMCWCPITCLDEADAAYEWQMGQFASTGTREEGSFTAALSADLAAAYADRVNEMGLVQDGVELLLEESDQGICLSGTYAEALTALVEESLNNFLEDTDFPYTPGSATMADGGFGDGLSGDGGLPDGDLPGGDLDSQDLPDSLPETDDDGDSDVQGSTTETLDVDEIVDGDIPDASDEEDGVARIDDSDSLPDGDLPDGDLPDSSQSGDDAGTSYDTAADYIESLNADEEWVVYDSSSNTASISGLGAFARVCKAPTKDVCAFDDLGLDQAENKVFTDGSQEGRHFDRLLASLLEANASTYADYEDWDSSYPDDYADDLAETDSLGLTVEERTRLYNPLYYLLEGSAGYGGSTPAPHWRIRTGITQGDTALTTEFNLAIALQANDAVQDVDFATVWGQGHTTAERTGDADDNFIEWVKDCLAAS